MSRSGLKLFLVLSLFFSAFVDRQAVAAMLAHLQNGQFGEKRILSEQTAQQMHSQLFTHDPRITGMAYGFYENKINGQRVLSHGGGTVIFSSKLYLIPDQNTGFFIATNAPGGANAREVVFREFMDHYYPAASHPAPAPAADFASRVAPYLGAYYPASNNRTTYEKLLSAFTQLIVRLDAQGNFVASAGGQTFQFVEIEPGLMRDRDNADALIVLQTDENGQAFLLTPEPSPWIKAPWYGTTSLHLFLVGFGLLLFAVTLAGWSVSALIRLRNRQPSPLRASRWARLARWIAALFAVLLVVFVIGWVSLDTPDPAFGVRALAFGHPPLFYALSGLAFILAGLGALMLVFALLGWVRRLGSLAIRLLYNLLALSAIGLLWVLWYWNLL